MVEILLVFYEIYYSGLLLEKIIWPSMKEVIWPFMSLPSGILCDVPLDFNKATYESSEHV